MEIKCKQENEATVVDLIGRIDTNTSADFQKELEEYYTKEGFSLILNFENLDFVSSAGLRVLLLIQKKANALKGKMLIKNVKPEIQEVFEMTGFSGILTIE
ncbi:STAS domain-containing protein [Acetobacterium bakii]|uniref:Anti-sigma factor antagonist n=1 Tax=Acetobacterium bakii TaxID=52689 RepID=A0A0L6TYS8_9FIRM|nr:STAS domain-containing protein [Acetobacterium bakii]KNZ41414.1 hypothetical protein AKG39_12415 [Acetobacterium bakii]